MSGSNLTSLIRNSKFASYDPLITRVYTADTSARRRGEWGFKYNLPKTSRTQPGKRYVRLRSMDAGGGAGCDYTSAEKEARVMSLWGDGRYGWTGTETENSYTPNQVSQPKTSTAKALESLMQPAANKSHSPSKNLQLYLPDVEGMSQSQFEKHLKKVRGLRKQFAETVATGKTRSEANTGTSLYQLRNSNWYAPADGSTFLAENVATFQLEKEPITPRPHATYGMAYSSGSYADIQLHPILALPGRALNSHSMAGVRRRLQDQQLENPLDESVTRDMMRKQDLEEKVVGIAGITAKMPRARSEGISSMNTTGSEPMEKSTSQFRISHAAIISPPKIVTRPPKGLPPSALSDETYRHINPLTKNHRHAKPDPLSRWQFDMRVFATQQAEKQRRQENNGDLLIGSKGWTGAEKESMIGFLGAAMHRANKSRQEASAKNTTKADRSARTRSSQSSQLDEIQNVLAMLGNIGHGGGGHNDFGGPRSYHTSAVRQNQDKQDLPTASIGPGEGKGSQDVNGPGIGGQGEEGVAKGEWRQLEDQVSGSETGNTSEKKE